MTYHELIRLSQQQDGFWKNNYAKKMYNKQYCELTENQKEFVKECMEQDSE